MRKTGRAEGLLPIRRIGANGATTGFRFTRDRILICPVHSPLCRDKGGRAVHSHDYSELIVVAKRARDLLMQLSDDIERRDPHTRTGTEALASQQMDKYAREIDAALLKIGAA